MPASRDRRSLPARALLAAIRGYQVLLSPLVGGSCRFVPSCSHYAAEAVRRHGAVSGAWLGLRRLSRCHPFGSSGFDPVPDQWPPPPAAGGPRRELPGALLDSGDAPSPLPGWSGGRLR
jgi:putative membrane protein insertion efficiency factor